MLVGICFPLHLRTSEFLFIRSRLLPAQLPQRRWLVLWQVPSQGDHTMASELLCAYPSLGLSLCSSFQLRKLLPSPHAEFFPVFKSTWLGASLMRHLFPANLPCIQCFLCPSVLPSMSVLSVADTFPRTRGNCLVRAFFTHESLAGPWLMPDEDPSLESHMYQN